MSPAVIRLDHVYAHAPWAAWKARADPAVHARGWAPGDVRPVVGHRFELDRSQWGEQPCEVHQVECERLGTIMSAEIRTARRPFGAI